MLRRLKRGFAKVFRINIDVPEAFIRKMREVDYAYVNMFSRSVDHETRLDRIEADYVKLQKRIRKLEGGKKK